MPVRRPDDHTRTQRAAERAASARDYVRELNRGPERDLLAAYLEDVRRGTRRRVLLP